MKNIKKLSFIVIATLVLVGSFVSSVPKVLAAAGEGTATIAVDGGTQGSGVTVVQSTSHVFTTVLTVGTSGMTLGASSPTFTIPTGFTAPHANGGAAVPANAGQVDVDGEWFAVAAGCTVTMGSSGASGQVITIDVTADCAAGNTITLTYKGTRATAMGSTALEVRTADGAPAAALIASSPTITVTDVSATPTPTSALTPTPTPTTSPSSTPTPTPTSTPTSSPTSSSSPSSSPFAPVCIDTAPTNNPDLFQIDRSGSKATLYFTPVNDHLSYYYVAYGLSPGDERYGVSFSAGLSSGVVNFTINDLNPNTTYYFKVRGGSGCMPGGWSNNKESNSKNPSLPNTGFAPRENTI